MRDGGQLALSLRLADPLRDAEAVAAIYAPVVLETVISFEDVAPDATEMRGRMERVLAWAPWLVAEANGTVVGYAYAARHRERAAYRWSVDLSAYVAETWRGQGVGRALYDRLLELLRDSDSSTRTRGSPSRTRPASRCTARSGCRSLARSIGLAGSSGPGTA